MVVAGKGLTASVVDCNFSAVKVIEDISLDFIHEAKVNVCQIYMVHTTYGSVNKDMFDC